MKKFIVVFVVFVSLYSCTKDADLTESEMISLELASKSSSDNVQLLKAWSSNGSSPVNQSYRRNFTVKVKNLAYQKEVLVYHFTKQGRWIDIPLTYQQRIDDDYEIWEVALDLESDELGDEFVVKYMVNEVVYWDNNDGENYRLAENSGAYLAPEMLISVDSFYTRYSGGSFDINVDVQHSNDPSTEIEVRYSTDGWSTFETVPLSFYNFFRVGYANYIVSPNEFNVSKYITTIQVGNSIDSIEFALVYRSNGGEYWDNNYGNNYRVEKVIF